MVREQETLLGQGDRSGGGPAVRATERNAELPAPPPGQVRPSIHYRLPLLSCNLRGLNNSLRPAHTDLTNLP